MNVLNATGFTLKMAKMVNFMLHIFSHNHKKKRLVEDAVLARMVRAGVLEEVAFEQRFEMKGLSRP